MFQTIGGHVPPPPDFAQPPLLWGSEEHVRAMLEPHGLELEFDRQTVAIGDDSVEDVVSMYEDKFGPLVMAKMALGDRWPELRADFARLFEEWNSADDGSVRVEAEYLVTVGRKRAD